MCFKQFKEQHRQIIESEKNIQIRERHERRMRYNYIIFLILFLGGGIYIGRQFLSFIEGGIFAILFLLYYLFLESVQKEYAEYTDKLIREQNQKKRNPRRKKK
ncbi:MAG: hypothetical protein ACLFSN_02420 [Candidatus Woesearchaeota archaeon]